MTDFHCSPARPVVLRSALPDHGEAAGIDLREVHSAVAHDGTHTTILNGGQVLSVRRYQNKTKGTLSTLIGRKKKGSRRRRRLIRAKLSPEQ